MVLVVIGLIGAPTVAQNRLDDGGPSDERSATGSIRVRTSDPAGSAADVDFKVQTLDAQEVEAELNKALAQKSDSIIVSSDDDVVLERAVEASKAGPPGRTFLLPFGKAIRKTAQIAGGANELLRKSGHYLVDTAKHDKIGFALATFTLSNEIVRWVHVTTASNFVISSNIVYTILWSAIFLNKDTWSRTTRPIQRTYRRLLGLSEVIPDAPNAQDTALKFLSGLSLSLALNGGRAALVGIDQLAQHTFSLVNLSMPFVMGAVMTAAGFSWSELMGSIDEGDHPRAKTIMRYVMNSRSCLVGYFAASAMLMNPESYGLMPWLAVTLSGATGLVLYSNVKKLVPFLDTIGRRPRTC